MKQTAELMLIDIDDRIGKLQQMRALIIEEFGDSQNGGRSQRKQHINSQTPRTVAQGEATGRKYQIHGWLKQNGPATRSEIIQGSGLPVGTVSGYLSAEKTLFKNRNGKWYAR